MAKTSVPNAPSRNPSQNDKAILHTTSWSKRFNLQFEDKVTVADSKAVFLTGLVMYVGSVHFAKGIWVGIQLIGPSIGKGNSDGSYHGKDYFAKVGNSNGVMAPLHEVYKYDSENTLSPDEQRATVDVLTNTRVASILKEDEKHRKKIFYKEEMYIKRLKNTSLGDAIAKMESRGPVKLKYSLPGATLCDSDFELVKGLVKTHQNFCLSDPTLPDNPITYASQAFLDLTGYRLSEILGVNCRFLQGENTEKQHVSLIRQSIVEGADSHVCLLNYRKDGTPFYNRLFMTALRDRNGRIKNYLGVQCEVSESQAMEINEVELKLFDAGMGRKGTKFTKRNNEVEVQTGSVSSLESNATAETECQRPLDSYDIDEAILRITLADPFGPMTPEQEALYQELKNNPFAGYTTPSPVHQ